jgi:hypothetical protein
MRLHGNAIRQESNRQPLQALANDAKAKPMHRALALVRLKNTSRRIFHDRCLQILHDA